MKLFTKHSNTPDFSASWVERYAKLPSFATQITKDYLTELLSFLSANQNIRVGEFPLNHAVMLILKESRALKFFLKERYRSIEQRDLLVFLFFVELLKKQDTASDIGYARFFAFFSVFQFLIMHALVGTDEYKDLNILDVGKYDMIAERIRSEK